MNENYEVEMMETECTDIDEFEADGGNSKSGLIPKLVVGAGLVTVAAIAIGKKLKSKKDEEPKKKRKFHIGWIDVDDTVKTNVEIVEAEVVEDK